MNIQGIAFDLEGAVVDVEAAHHQGHLQVAEELGVRLALDEALKQIPHFIGGPDEKIAEEIWALAGKPEKTSVEEILKRDKDLYNEFLKSLTIQPRPGFLEVFEAIKKAGYPTSIGSLTPSNQAKTLLDRSGVGKLFPEDRIILKEHVARPKPAPDVFLETARRMKIDPRGQLVFEDSPRGVEAALTAGSKAIGMPVYNLTETISALTKAGAFRIFTDWRAVDIVELIKNLDS